MKPDCKHRFSVYANQNGDFVWGAYQCEFCKIITDDENATKTNPHSLSYDKDFKLENFNVLKIKKA